MTRADFIVTLGAVALLPFLYVASWGNGARGEQARILVGGKEYARVPLYQAQRLEIPGALGVSVLEIKDGKIRFIASPCRGKQCVHSGWLALSGEFAACLPNRISVHVAGREPRYDAVNF